MKKKGKNTIHLGRQTTLFSFIGFFSILILLSSMNYSPSSIAVSGEWKAPPEADKLKNPYKENVEATAEGKKIYTQYCAVCHGDKGKGDGMAG